MRAFGMWRVCGFYVFMAGVGLTAMGKRIGSELLPETTWAAWGSAVLSGLATGVGLMLASRLAATHLPWVRALAGEFRNMMGNLAAREAFLVALLSGTSEEILFRGALQPALGLPLTAVIFGILHVGPTRRFIPWTVMALAAGLLFGVLYQWSGNVVAPALAHITVNFLNLRYLAESRGPAKMMAVGPARQRAVYF